MILLFVKLKQEGGAIYIMALAMMMLLTTFAVTFIKVARDETKLNKNYLDALRAFYAAEACYHIVALELKLNQDINTGFNKNGGDATGHRFANKTIDEFTTCEAEYDDMAETITSVGKSIHGKASKTIEIKLKRSEASTQINPVNQIDPFVIEYWKGRKSKKRKD